MKIIQFLAICRSDVMIGSVNGTVLKSPEVVLDPSDGKALPRITVNGTRRRCLFLRSIDTAKTIWVGNSFSEPV